LGYTIIKLSAVGCIVTELTSPIASGHSLTLCSLPQQVVNRFSVCDESLWRGREWPRTNWSYFGVSSA